jgi:diguanylate cyclase (GGDEF)-like protein/PAS domain S-box-containing protein
MLRTSTLLVCPRRPVPRLVEAPRNGRLKSTRLPVDLDGVDDQDLEAAKAVPARTGPEELIDDRYLLDTFLEHTPDHVYFKDAQSRFIRISRALAHWLGLQDATEAIGRTDFDFFDEEHARKAFADEQRLMRSAQPLVAIEERETWRDGRETWVSTTKVPLRDRNGNIVGVFGSSRDITGKKQDERRLTEQAEQLAEQSQFLERLATIDELTGLYNRRGLSMIGEQMLYEARANGSSLSILFIDLDGLKEINDRYGHRAGDEALKAVGKALRETARESDLAARVGGDEFCLLIPQASEAGSVALAGRIETTLSNLGGSEHLPYQLSVSVGTVAVDPRAPGSLDDLLTRADEAMYQSKHHAQSA